jgi:hypothetical protein
MTDARNQRLRLATILLVLGLAAAAGCSDRTATTSPPGTAGSPAPGAAPLALLPEGETWEVYTMQGSRVGHGRTTVAHVEEDGRTLLQIDALVHLAIPRFNQTTEQTIAYTSFETPDGRLVRFESELTQGTVPQRSAGRVEGDALTIETTTLGKTTRETIPWSPERRGFYAIEGSLLRRPMAPGERRRFEALVVATNQAAEIEIVAGDYEPVELPGGTYDLLRVEAVTRFADGQALPTLHWCDRTGDILKTEVDLMELAIHRAPKEVALEKTDPPSVDLGWDVVVKVDRPIPRAHRTRTARYRLELSGGDPAGVFVTGASQQVRSLGPHAAEVTVYALRPGERGGNEAAPADPPTEADRRPNNFIQSDHPKIAAMAAEVAGDEPDPWQKALRLERHVYQYITKKDFSQAFATAAEVVEDPQGDCTEHAVLLAALCRAAGIPARVAIGLVYMDRPQAFGYHMWNEVHVEGRWIPLDATLGEGGIGAAHLKIAQSHLDGASAYTAFLPVVRVLGKLKIEVEEIDGP